MALEFLENQTDQIICVLEFVLERFSDGSSTTKTNENHSYYIEIKNKRNHFRRE